MISEAAKHVGVEAHVLRNWEKELALPIPRNEMDQRYYKESDIELLKRVKLMKENGYQLKAIKMSLTNPKFTDSISANDAAPKKETDDKVIELFPGDKPAQEKDGTSLIPEGEENKVQEESSSKLGQFKAIMNHIILSALKENNGVLTDEISENVTDGVIREMNYLMRIQEEKEEERFRKFDMTLREYQKSKMMAAAATDKKRNKSKFLKKNRIYI
jgi:DNA-binding transcriptional MerR regulator